MAATLSGVQFNPILVKSLKSAADYSAAQTSVFVTITGDQIVTKSGTGEQAIGIMINKPGLGEAAEVVVLGTAPLKLTGTVAQNDYIKVDSVGTGIKSDTNLEKACAIALQDGDSGDEIEVLIIHGERSK